MKKPSVTSKIYDMIQYCFTGMRNMLMTPNPWTNETNRMNVTEIASVKFLVSRKLHPPALWKQNPELEKASMFHLLSSPSEML